ncbi:hypothetical protein LTR36_007968 [Oleoguttula mirabilis]|uniref:Uncharacterized protein n=1 Tax=Oleoguttula mirabilis TaxID=1507867 RepID=A0AAV9JAU6_9PEZI|nr:hypothetical protein LTR36_007968 [Oleoguttula mirabilis]
MAFHYEPPADLSSDDEGGAPIDLSTWQGHAAKNAAPRPAQAVAPTAPMVVQVDDSDDELAQDPLASFQSSQHTRNRNGTTTPIAAPAPPARRGSGFTSINRSDTVVLGAAAVEEEEDAIEMPDFDANNIPVGDEDEDEQEEEEDDGEDEIELIGQPLVPIIPRDDVNRDDGEVVDMTAGEFVVRRVVEELEREDMVYRVELGDYSVEELPFEVLLTYDNGQEALEDFTNNPPTSAPEPQLIRQPKAKRSTMSSTRPSRARTQHTGFVGTIDAVSADELGSDDEITLTQPRSRKRKPEVSQYVEEGEGDDEEDEEFAAEEETGRRSGLRTRQRKSNAPASRSTRSGRQSDMVELEEDNEEVSDDDLEFLQSDLPGARKRKRGLRTRGQGQVDLIDDDDDDGIGYSKSKRQRTGERQSGRSTRHQGGMQEVEVNDVYRSDSNDGIRAPAKTPKAVGAREAFKALPRGDEFRMRHKQECEVCGQGANFAQLIYCQGCTLAYHKSCLGHRTTREHLVTKVGDGDFVLQCRRCVAYPRKKDPTAPDQGKCAECREHGHACLPFRPRKSTAQEQKERDENGGDDPVIDIHNSRINNPENVIFRCVGCWRGFHFEHLPSRSDMMDLETEADAEQRFREYSRDWKCKECLSAPAKVGALIAWKPIDEDNYDPALAFDMIDEDEKAYLLKWDGMSYFRATWMPGAWVWGTTTHMMRKAFAKRDDSQHPKMRTEDAIPEDYLRTDIVLDIKFTSIVDIRAEEVDKARIREIDKALIKYKGLGYEDAVWDAPPNPEDGERWTDFVTAYNDWVSGRYVRLPTQGKLKKSMEKVRTQDFSKLEKKSQPENLEGGELMKYQIEGLNWLYYKWFTQKNAILADEMGLGKTIQIIGFLATLVQDHACWPFLVVVPNSTCPNWRRELKRWAPSLRVVAYYGSKESRDLAYRYELFPEGSKDLRCHVVVTSYDGAADENCRKFFRSVPWQGLIVDEGQRLKNDKNILYAALGALKAPFRILLTGTPLQNNQRELFNLLHFLDDSYNAVELEQRFQELTQEKITELHDMIRPFFLRRTKAQVLTFLPPMAQIIVPVSMTIVQKKLYRTILAKNPDLMKAIFAPEGTLRQGERASLSNILMQLRKCLCHPFVYSKSIEERNVSHSASHRNLVDASSKLQLLELLLPKLRERGHRVLIFSQFLDMLDMVEDFMDGMSMPYQRLDGTIGALVKQKRIDEFNAPDSPLFAFLLSTRAGGVGINLASADTVIILDPDFNPHQDIQALSRAHRIGQKKKVLCFQLVTRASAEERIMQMGRRKLALDHVLIQEMDADDAEQNDLVSVLRHGANELFEDSGEQDIHYDAESVERLLDRSRMENTRAGEGERGSAETQWSHARIWANGAGALVQEEDMLEAAEPAVEAPDPGVWAHILKERERVAAEEAKAKAEAFGRGRRVRGAVDYAAGDKEAAGAEGFLGEGTPMKVERKMRNGDESDTDFQADESGDDEDPDASGEELDRDDAQMVAQQDAKRDAGRVKPSAGKTPTTLHPKHKNGVPTPAATPTKAITRKATSTKPGAATPTKSRRARAAPKTSALAVKKSDAVAPPAPPRKGAAPRAKAASGAKPKMSTTPAKNKGGQASASNMKKSTAASPASPEVVAASSNTLAEAIDLTSGGEADDEDDEDDDEDEDNIKLAAPSSVVSGDNNVSSVMPPPPASSSTPLPDNTEPSAYRDYAAAAPPTFRRVTVPQPRAAVNSNGLPTPPTDPTTNQNGGASAPAPPTHHLAPSAASGINCLACRTFHPIGSCPLKLAGVEHCNLCGMAHFGHARICPHIQSETQVRAMLETLRYSNEPEHLVTEARKYLRGLKGNLVQLKKKKEEKEHAAREAEAAAAFQYARAPIANWQAS